MQKFLLNTTAIFLLVLLALCLFSCNSKEKISNGNANVSVNNSANNSQAPEKTDDDSYTPGDKIFTGKYEDPVFGFYVLLPDGLYGSRDSESPPKQGFVIDLSEKEEAKLYVNANYNSDFHVSLEEEYSQQMVYLHDDAKNLRQVEKKEVTLDKFPAILFTVSYAGRLTNSERITSRLIGMRKCTEEMDPDRIEVIYTVDLDTTKQRFNEDKKAMKKIIDSWKMLDKCS